MIKYCKGRYKRGNIDVVNVFLHLLLIIAIIIAIVNVFNFINLYTKFINANNNMVLDVSDPIIKSEISKVESTEAYKLHLINDDYFMYGVSGGETCIFYKTAENDEIKKAPLASSTLIHDGKNIVEIKRIKINRVIHSRTTGDDITDEGEKYEYIFHI